MTNAPKIAPKMLPRPPIKLAPPITHAAMASNSNKRPASGLALPTRAVMTTTGDRHQCTHRRKYPQRNTTHVDTGEVRRFGVTTDRIDVTSETGVVGDKMKDKC